MSSEAPAIAARGLSKRYRLGLQASYGRLTEALARLPSRIKQGTRRSEEEFWALADVDLDIQQGDVIGLIGRNGSGKSTLLKILSRVTRPTEGHAVLLGRVGSLLEVGTGFHPELTGRENIYLSGAVLGMNRREIDQKFEEIVAFAEVESFLDTPVKRFSSGMQVRLGFAVAAHLDTEILLIDEVLAVGDVGFQQRCMDRMEEAGKSGRTIILVSHNPAAISRLCTSTILLENGRVVFNGSTSEALQRYVGGESTGNSWTSNAHVKEQDFTFLAADLRIAGDQRIEQTTGVEPFVVDITYHLKRRVTGLMVGLILHHQSGAVVLETYEFDGLGRAALQRDPGVFRARCHFPAGLLNSGSYWFSLIAFEHNVEYLQVEPRALNLNVWDTAVPGAEYSMNRTGVIAPSLRWELE